MSENPDYATLPNINLRQEFFKVLGGIAFIIVLISVIRYFKLGTMGRIVLLSCINLIFMIIFHFRGSKFSIKKFVMNIAYITFFVFALHFINKIGFWG